MEKYSGSWNKRGNTGKYTVYKNDSRIEYPSITDDNNVLAKVNINHSLVITKPFFPDGLSGGEHHDRLVNIHCYKVRRTPGCP